MNFLNTVKQRQSQQLLNPASVVTAPEDVESCKVHPKIWNTSSVVDIDLVDPLKRRHLDEKVVGLGEGVRRILYPPSRNNDDLSQETSQILRRKRGYPYYDCNIPLEEDENDARSNEEKRPLVLDIIGFYTACKIFVYYLVSLSSLVTVGLSIGLTYYWYHRFQNETSSLSSTGMDWVLLSFAVITPLSLSIGIAFRRRELALIEIAKFRSNAFQTFIAHCIWDWDLPPRGKVGSSMDWVEHADDVLRELISIGDELCRFLTLPTTSRSRHRMTRSGRREAARTAEVAYRLYDSLYTRRFVKLSQLSDKIKLAGLGASEVSRIRQYERYMGEAIENLRMYKTYRTPQTLRSFARIFTALLPPVFTPTFARLAVNVDSIAIGVIFAMITALCLNALFEGVEILEDPFVAFVTLDGIDVREEFQVLHWQQLVRARNAIFPNALPYVGQATVFVTGDMLGDIESSQTKIGAEIPTGSGSEASHASHRKRHRTHSSMGHEIFLTGVKNDTEQYRESGYRICSTSKKNIIVPSLHDVKTLTKASGNNDEEEPHS